VPLTQRIEFIDVMPFTKAEKIDKRALREDIEKKRYRSEAPFWDL
jgi:acyl-CoA synthetase (AMP-forming)/AMP-acid ligase II